MKKLVQEIYQMSYPNFVAFIGQKNTPPGAQRTVEFWIDKGKIDKSSYVLDIACTTGFSSRLVVEKKRCRVHGVDLSKDAISVAQKEAQKSEFSKNLVYSVGDISKLKFADELFTHVLAGCNFSFIQARDKALKEVSRVLKSRGLLGISNFYYTCSPPLELLDRVEKVISFRPNPAWTADFWKSFLSREFHFVTGRDYQLSLMDEKELRRKIRYHIFGQSPLLRDYSQELKEACCQRLIETRLVLNKHRQYQKYSVEIWRKNGI